MLQAAAGGKFYDFGPHRKARVGNRFCKEVWHRVDDKKTLCDIIRNLVRALSYCCRMWNEAVPGTLTAPYRFRTIVLIEFRSKSIGKRINQLKWHEILTWRFQSILSVDFDCETTNRASTGGKITLEALCPQRTVAGNAPWSFCCQVLQGGTDKKSTFENMRGKLTKIYIWKDKCVLENQHFKNFPKLLEMTSNSKLEHMFWKYLATRFAGWWKSCKNADVLPKITSFLCLLTSFFDRITSETFELRCFCYSQETCIFPLLLWDKCNSATTERKVYS